MLTRIRILRVATTAWGAIVWIKHNSVNNNVGLVISFLFPYKGLG
jgi:hypothetical protein